MVDGHCDRPPARYEVNGGRVQRRLICKYSESQIFTVKPHTNKECPNKILFIGSSLANKSI